MIEAKSLTKCFGDRTVVENVSFTVLPGEVLGFLGPNGAGKSTTMRMLTGFLPPTSGTAVIEGFDVLQSPLEARRRLGYLPENAPSYPEMSVDGFLSFIAEIRGYTGREKTRRVEETLTKCFLEDVRYQTIGTLSKGYRQRVCFAQSILHDPTYLIMDEPTDGLDPNQKHEVRSMIRTMAREKAIILSTHILEEMEAVCTRVIIIARGRLILDETPAGLKARSPGHGAVLLTLHGQGGEALVPGLEGLPNVRSIEVVSRSADATILRAFPQDPVRGLSGPVMGFLSGRGVTPGGLAVEEGRLDEVFRRVTLERDGEKEAA